MHDVFFFTDLHGAMPLFQAIIEWIDQQEKEAMIIYGGDACDRGQHGIAIMEALLDDPRIIYLKGNHEDLFVKAARAIIDAGYPQKMYTIDEAAHILDYMYAQDDVWLHIQNGGLPTLRDWIINGMDTQFVNLIDNLPITFRHDVCDFCHAGGNPKDFERVLNAENDMIHPSAEAIKNMLWDRNCFGLGWFKDRICVHGHTPTVHLPSKFYGSKNKSEANIHPAWWYGPFEPKKFPGLKINMDTGATWGGRIWVLNCLTLKATSFFDLSINSKDTNHIIKIGQENYYIKQ